MESEISFADFALDNFFREFIESKCNIQEIILGIVWLIA